MSVFQAASCERVDAWLKGQGEVVADVYFDETLRREHQGGRWKADLYLISSSFGS